MLGINSRNSTLTKPSDSLWGKIDRFTIILYLLIAACGWLMVLSASSEITYSSSIQLSGRPMMQLIWMGISFLLVVVLLFIPADFFEVVAKPYYLLMLLLLLVTVFVAPDIKGSRSWLVMGPIRLQPAEFAKMATALMLAHTFSRYQFRLKGWKNYIEVFAIILLPMLIIFMQSEAGSALVFTAFFLVLYREEMSGFFLGVGSLWVILFVAVLSLSGQMWGSTPADRLIASVILTIALLLLLALYTRKNKLFIKLVAGGIALQLVGYWICTRFCSIDFSYITLGFLTLLMGYCLYQMIKQFSARYLVIVGTIIVSLLFAFSVEYAYENILQPHQQMRIAVALGLEDDLQGVGYNVHQAQIAIGSGGLVGKGFLKGTQTKLNYVPEQGTDFIYCTIAEDCGFIGAGILLVLYIALILRLMFLSERSASTFVRIYGYGVACVLLLHVTINIGMVLGIVPVIGIPLPFCSYGGSSFVSFTLMLFVFLRMEASS